MSRSTSALLTFVALLHVGSCAAEQPRGTLVEKAEASLRHWEFGRQDYRKRTVLSETEKIELKEAVAEARNEPANRGLFLLAALNCVEIGVDKPFAFLYSYLCQKSDAAILIANSVKSFDDVYALSFAKPADRELVLKFLRDYIAFLKARAYLAESGLEYFEEIVGYLEETNK